MVVFGKLCPCFGKLCPHDAWELIYNDPMLGLNQDTVNFIVTCAVVLMVPFLGLGISAMLVRQLPKWGFSNYSWGPSDPKDSFKIDRFKG